ncbi:hypothetical protein Tco_0357283 [Tanacetum coccineum]
MSNTNLPTQTSSVLQNDTVSSCSTSKVQEKTQLSRIKCMNSLRAIQSQLKFLIETLQDFGNVKKSIAERTRHQRQYERRVNQRQIQMQESKIDTGKALDANLVDTESIRTYSTVQDDNSRLGNDTNADDADIRPIYDEEPMAEVTIADGFTLIYLPKKTDSAFAKPDHMIASSTSRNSTKNMPRFSSNDMVHNHYLDVAKKKIQERDRNSTTSVTTSARFQSTADDSKPKPRSNNQTSRSLRVSKSTRDTIVAVPKADHSKSSSSFSDSKNIVCSTCHKCIFNANHDACITKILKEVNSRAKIQFQKTKNSNKPVDQKSHTQKPSRQIFTGHRFSPNKTSAVYEKTSPRSDLSTSINVQKEQSLDLSAEVHQAAETVTTLNDQDLLFGPLFDEYFNRENQVVLKSSAVTTTDASNTRQQQPDSTLSTSTLYNVRA